MDVTPRAYLNGQWIDGAIPAIPANDAGFVLGATLSEQLRTFGGRLFELDRHLARLERSLQLVGIPLPEPLERIARIANELAAHNAATLSPDADLGMAILVTPGPYAALAIGAAPSATLCLHTYPLPFGLWADRYENGQSLVIPGVRQVPALCWPPALKCRSRMHYYLADREAALCEPGAKALLLDLEGHVAETSTANVLAWLEGEGLVSPPRDRILPGISLAVTRQLAASLKIPCCERPLTLLELQTAGEVLLTSTPFCLLPVTRIDGQPIGAGCPGEVFQELIAAWNRRTGVDIVGQATRCAGPCT